MSMNRSFGSEDPVFKDKAPEDFKVLAIETSCDETSSAVVRGGRVILSNVVSSQIDVHRKFGGVVPEIASRKHVEMLIPVVDEAIKNAGMKVEDVDAVASTYGPGLVGALLVGLSGAKAVAFALGVPFIGVNHVEGHIYANMLSHEELEPPFICLTVSGGHTELMLMKEHGDYITLGRTRDDAAGEAFDKVARVMGLPYPGGPFIDELAKKGDPHAVKFPKAHVAENELDFSFSGIKTAVINYLHSESQRGNALKFEDVAASFQMSVVDALVERACRAVELYNVRRVCLSGGVSANSMLRKRLKDAGEKSGFEVYYPPLSLCTDNAAMVACAAHYRLMKGERSPLSLNAVPGARIV